MWEAIAGLLVQSYNIEYLRHLTDYNKAMVAWRAKMVAAGYGDVVEKVVPSAKHKKAVTSIGARK
jgi:hypothetical protein